MTLAVLKRNGWNWVGLFIYREHREKRKLSIFAQKNSQNGLSCLLCSHTVRSQEKTSIEDKCKAGWARRCFKNTFDYSLSLSRCDGQLCFSSRSLLTCSTTGTVSNVIKIDMHLVLFQQRIWHRRFLVFVQNIFHTDCKDCGDVWSKRWHHFQKASARPFPSHGHSFFSQKHLNSTFQPEWKSRRANLQDWVFNLYFSGQLMSGKKNTQKLFFCPMQRPAMEKVQVTRDHDKRAGEWCIVWGAPPPARTSNAHLQSHIRDVSSPHTADIVFLCVQEIRRHLARSLVSLVGSQWWWWWWPMRRAGQHQGGRRTNLYLYLDFLLYLYLDFHLYLYFH